MSFSSKIKEAKKALAAVPMPATSLELKYGRAKDAQTAWRLYFKYLLISLTSLTSSDLEVRAADVISLPLNKKQKLYLEEILNFLHQAVSDLSNAVLEFTYVMKKFNDNETFDMILMEFYADFAAQLVALRQRVNKYKQQATSLALDHTDTYKKYAKYLDELSRLTAETFVHEYLLKNKIPLEDFDDEFLEPH